MGNADLDTARPVPREVWRARIPLTDEQIADFCRRWQIVELDAFGSVLRDDFDEDSDLDFLVTLGPGVHWPWTGLSRMEGELSSITHRRVEVGFRDAVEQSENALRREHILRSRQALYAA